MPADVRKSVVRMAAGNKGRMLVLDASALAPWKKAGAKEVVRLRWDPNRRSEVAEAVARADVVWRPGPTMGLPKVRQAVKACVDRGGAVVLGRSKYLGASRAAPSSLRVLPNAHIFLGDDAPDLSNMDRWVRREAGCLGIHVPTGVALVVSGRRLRVIGGGRATVTLAKSHDREKRTLVVRRRSPLDYGALARAALARSWDPYPPKKRVVTSVEKGTVIAVGGGSMPRSIMRRFVTAAGGSKAFIVNIPTATGDPLPQRDYMTRALRAMGVRNVKTLHARAPEDIDDAFLAACRKATGVWFGGGRQWRLVDAYYGTKAHECFRQVLDRGGVIAGSSAGATISGSYLVRGHPLGNTIMMAEGYERGLGFLPGMAIDQHFSQRNRFKDMTAVHRRHPHLLGIGLDEGTAIIVTGTKMEILGLGAVAVYDGTRTPDGEDHRRLTEGDVYDLIARKPVE